jgi:hypothetical protein
VAGPFFWIPTNLIIAKIEAKNASIFKTGDYVPKSGVIIKIMTVGCGAGTFSRNNTQAH